MKKLPPGMYAIEGGQGGPGAGAGAEGGAAATGGAAAGSGLRERSQATPPQDATAMPTSSAATAPCIAREPPAEAGGGGAAGTATLGTCAGVFEAAGEKGMVGGSSRTWVRSSVEASTKE